MIWFWNSNWYLLLSSCNLQVKVLESGTSVYLWCFGDFPFSWLIFAHYTIGIMNYFQLHRLPLFSRYLCIVLGLLQTTSLTDLHLYFADWILLEVLDFLNPQNWVGWLSFALSLNLQHDFGNFNYPLILSFWRCLATKDHLIFTIVILAPISMSGTWSITGKCWLKKFPTFYILIRANASKESC